MSEIFKGKILQSTYGYDYSEENPMKKDKTINCKHLKDEICVNADCPCCTDYCPCGEYQEICKYAEDETYTEEELLQIDTLT